MGQQFEQMAVRVVKVDAPATVPIIELPVFRIPRMAAVCQPSFLCSLKNGVEFVVTHVKRIVMRLKRIVLIEIKRESVIHTHRSEMPGRALILEPEDVG